MFATELRFLPRPLLFGAQSGVEGQQDRGRLCPPDAEGLPALPSAAYLAEKEEGHREPMVGIVSFPDAARRVPKRARERGRQVRTKQKKRLLIAVGGAGGQVE